MNDTPHSASLAEALRARSQRTARAEAFRYHLGMSLLGFVGGSALVVPAVLWLSLLPRASEPLPASAAAPAISSAVRATASSVPIVQAPLLVAREAASNASLVPTGDSVTGASVAASVATARSSPDNATREALDTARRLIKSGDLMGARRVLSNPGLAASGTAQFMLAETYDPNVLAALSATGVLAETLTARRLYESALAKGIDTAARRLEALE